MTHELITAIQNALSAQFNAGKAVGILEHLMLQAMPKAEAPAPEATPESPAAE